MRRCSGRVDEEQSAERPERLPAERGLAFLIEDDDPPSRIGELGGGHEARKPRADHDGVRVHVVPRAVEADVRAFSAEVETQRAEDRRELGEYAGELVVPVLLQGAADAPYRARDGDTNAGGDQGVFDRGRAALITEKAPQC
jgi:hypothetical protein